MAGGPKKMTKLKNKVLSYDYAKQGSHLPNAMHLDACRQGGRVYRNRKKYSRKGKARFDVKKEMEK